MMEDLTYKIRSFERDRRRAVAMFKNAVCASDHAGLGAAIEQVEAKGAWAVAMRACKGLDPSDDFRARFMRVWHMGGDGIRSETNDDIALMTGLRALLPKYSGGDVVLYRGDCFANRRHRTYGMSWTRDIEIARQFAEMYQPFHEGGAVLLKVHAPKEAIICAVHEDDEFELEQEIVVDRRLLKGVSVIERLANNGVDGMMASLRGAAE